MLLMVEKGVRGGIFRSINAKAINKWSYIQCWHVNNLYGWAV